MTSKTTIIAIILGLGLCGCTLLDAPEPADGEGTVTLHFVRNSPETSASLEGPALAVFAHALPLADSVAVSVFFPPGPGKQKETQKGAAIPPAASTVSVELTVIAQDNKRVAVELFQGGRLLFFGVDEDVDVRAGENTRVSINTAPFEITAFFRDRIFVAAGVNFNFLWNRVQNASSYLFEASLDSDFSVVAFDTTVTDTVARASLAWGYYHFRVRPQNDYAMGDASAVQSLYVYGATGAPTISGLSTTEAPRGEVVTATGTNLDYPGTTVTLGAVDCPILCGRRARSSS